MASHLTVRMAWHDNNWDGNVCKDPEKNVYCIGSHSLLSPRLARRRDTNLEIENKCKPIDKIDNYIPPCYWSTNAFSGTDKEITHEHPFERYKDKVIKERLKSFSVFSWPFKLCFVRNKEQRETFGSYFPIGQFRDSIRSFFDKFKENESIVFFYCNYDNPVSADNMKYLVLGCALLKDKAFPDLFNFSAAELNQIRSRHAMQNFDTLNWSMQFSFDFLHNGILLPYKEYIDYCALNPKEEYKLDEFKILIEEEGLIPTFKYVAMDMNDDKCLYLLYRLKKAISIMDNHKVVTRDFNKDYKVIDSLIEKTWKNRGLYPGLENILSIMLQNEKVSKEIISMLKNNVKEEKEIIDVLIKSIKEDGAIPNYLKKYKGLLDELFSAYPDYLDFIRKLSLFNLSKIQFKRIIFDEGHPFGKNHIKKEDVVKNPYLISENYKISENINKDPESEDEAINVFNIDIGMFPDGRFMSMNRELQNLSPSGPERLRNLTIEYLYKRGESGDCFANSEDIIKALRENPLFHKRDLHIEEQNVIAEEGVYFDHFEERLTRVEEKGKVYYSLNEVKCAEYIIRKAVESLKNKKDYPIEMNDNLKEYIEKSALELEKIPGFDKGLFIKERIEVINKALRKSFFVISGKPGSGKTYVLRKIIEYVKKAGEDFILLAPTGKAALRLSSLTGEQAKTIDKFIYENGFYQYLNDFTIINQARKNKEKVPVSNLIIDECSMVDLFKLAVLFSMIEIEGEDLKRIIMVGDENQLPPIGFGKPFFDIVDYLNPNKENSSENFIKLLSECRQQNDRTILELAEVFSEKRRNFEPIFEKIKKGGQISNGLSVDRWKNSEELVEKLENRLKQLIIDAFNCKSLDLDSFETKKQTFNMLHGLKPTGDIEAESKLRIDYFQILSPYRSGYFGTLGLNRYIHSYYKIDAADNSEENDFFIHSDKIIRIKNWYSGGILKLSNGAIGIVNGKKSRRKYYFPELSAPLESLDEEDNFELAYAITIHKAQGSDFDNVFLIIPRKLSLLSKELLYTALTRSKRKIYLFIQESEEDILQLARNRSFVVDRNTAIFKTCEEFKQEFKYWLSQGISVRSKVEYIIFKALENKNIKFSYEKKLRLKNKPYPIHPDFTIELPNGSEIYWEHLGMLDTKRYRQDWEERKKDYITNDLFENVITSDDLKGINEKILKGIIQDILTKKIKSTSKSEFSKHHYPLY